MPTKVPDRIADLDKRISMDPMLTAKLLPGRRASAEGVALGRGSFSTQGMQIAEGKSIGRAKSSCMV